MFIPPIERARQKRQQTRPTTTTAQAQNPLESLISNIFNPGSPTTSTKGSKETTTRLPAQPSESAVTTTTTGSISPSLISTTRATTSTSTSALTASSQRTSSSTNSLPAATPEDSNSINPSTVVVTQTASSPSGSPTVDASSSNLASSNGAMTPLVKGIVISASVIFGLIFFALVIRKLFQFRRRQKRVSWADNISPFAPTVNETGYEKPLPQEPAPILAPPAPPRFGSQDAGYGPMIGTGRPSFGANPDQRNSRYSTTGAGYATYPVPLQTMQPYVPAAPYTYNPAATGAGAAPAAVGGPSGLAYNSNNNNLAASPPEMPNPFIVSPVDTAGPVPITVPGAGAPPAAGQQILVVKRTFTPNLEDELSIAAGESVRIIAVYDDGWCKIRKLGAGGEEGVVPYECLDNPPAGAQPGPGNAEERPLEAR